MKNLLKIQTELKSPKNQMNKFGNYRYRSCEDILEAVKPLLKETECFLTINDEIIQVGERIYVKASARFHDGENSISTEAYAREEETKKGMDASQITGSASSYARKYALNGLFLIDDTKDADSTNQHGNDTKDADSTNQHGKQAKKVAEKVHTKQPQLLQLTKDDTNWKKCVTYLTQDGTKPEDLKKKYRFTPETQVKLMQDVDNLKKQSK